MGSPPPVIPSSSVPAAAVAYGEALEDSRACHRRRGRPLTVTPGVAAVVPGLEALAGSLGRGEVALGFITPAWAHGATAASRRRRLALAAATLLVTVERVEAASSPLSGVATRGYGARPPTPAGRLDGGANPGWPPADGRGACRGRAAAATASGGVAKPSSWPVRAALDGALGGGCQGDVGGAASVSDVTSDDEADPPAPRRRWQRAPCQYAPGLAAHRGAHGLPAGGSPV